MVHRGTTKSSSLAAGAAAIALLLTVVFPTRVDSFHMVSTPIRPKTAAPPVFNKDFAKPMQMPQESIDLVVDVLKSGRLNRYSSASAETSQVAKMEEEFAAATGQPFALGVNSCSSAILIALLSVGVKAGGEVLSNAFTFTAVPSAILRIGAKPVLVECLDSWTMDLDDLEKKAAEGKAKVLLLSHMRSKVCDMDRLLEICDKYDLALVEDCAHALGVTWRGEQLGSRAKVAAYSMQSDKLINSGEGGVLTTSDENIISNAIYLSGCYEKRYGKHTIRGSDELMEAAMRSQPNLSMRMTEITAAVIRPLLANLPERVAQFQRRYDQVAELLESEVGDLIEIPKKLEHASYVGDHLNFRLINPTEEENLAFQAKTKEMGVPLNYLRSPFNARWHVNWRGYGGPVQDLPATDASLATAYDLKLPPHFEDEDFPRLAENIAYAARVTVRANGD